MSDNLYYWTHIGSKGNRVLLGEVQCGKNPYNIGFSIDGMKDTAKFEVWSFDEPNPIKPYSVCFHEATNTWWIVSEDKVERIVNDNGYLYKHNIKLEGAIEVLNARDLTDCGFYQNTYTTEQFIRRLLDLSTFEFGGSANTSIDFGNNISADSIVTYIKSFENYTLLSALREFLDGYNCVAKLSFTQDNSTHKLVSCTLSIFSKCGNANSTPLDLDTTMKDPRGIGRMSKGSYGNCVISNASNVVSTKSKTYPTIGYAKLGSTDFYLEPDKDNIVVRLPSKVNSVEWVEMATAHKTKIGLCVIYGSASTDYFETEFDPTDIYSYERAIDFVRNKILNNTTQDIVDYFNEHYPNSYWLELSSQETLDKVLDGISLRFYDTKEYDPLTNTFISDKPINIFHSDLNPQHGNDKPWVLGNKSLRNGTQEPESVMYWERGSSEIKGFNFFKWHETINDSYKIKTKATLGYELLNTDFFRTEYLDEPRDRLVQIFVSNDLYHPSAYSTYMKRQFVFSFLDASVRCKYIPMSDLKIKYDNEAVGNDSKLYNQNGKYTDAVALSKSLLSYKDEIASDTITRYSIGYSLSSMPKVGDIFSKDGVDYVVGNASYDLSQHEEDTHYIVGEYTLSKKIAIKSALTNPNTNIRDYGIPQQYNVPRKQVYRDFYELSYTPDSNADNIFYLTLGNALNLTFSVKDYDGHTALVKITYENPCGGGGDDYEHYEVDPSDEWYFQVDSTYYTMKKSFYEVFNFQDNNIIGYDSQNMTCGFDIRRLFTMLSVGSSEIDATNTPISYVDEKGRFEGASLCVSNSRQLKKIWDIYISEMEASYTNNTGLSYFNRCVFIPKRVYEIARSYNDYEINDFHYKKDAIEVPVFEYCCQIDDSDNVIVGDDIFNSNDDDLMYLYEAVIVPHGSINENNWRRYFTPNTLYKSGDYIVLDDDLPNINKKACSFTTTDTELRIRLTDSVSFNGSTAIYGSNVNANTWLHNYAGSDKVDLMIVRYTIKKDYTAQPVILTSGVQTNLMFVLKDAVHCPYSSNLLVTYINHYKLN